LDLSIIQGPFSDAPCQTLISRFATFSLPYRGPCTGRASRLAAAAAAVAACNAIHGEQSLPRKVHVRGSMCLRVWSVSPHLRRQLMRSITACTRDGDEVDSCRGYTEDARCSVDALVATVHWCITHCADTALYN
jgi:hypothetical protein